MALARCVQLNLALDSDEPTTIVRAVNIRRRMDPPFGAGYFGNAIAQLYITFSVAQLFSMNIQEIAMCLREKILEYSAKKLATRVLWEKEQQKTGANTVTKFDSKALTFIVSSWCFPKLDWSDANFAAKPLCFDHACFVPFVSVITRRPGGDGVNIWTSGTKEAVTTFANSLVSNDAMYASGSSRFSNLSDHLILIISDYLDTKSLCQFINTSIRKQLCSQSIYKE